MSATNSTFGRDATPTISHASNELLQSADKAVDATRGYAIRALDKAEDKTRELQNDVNPLVAKLAAKAQKLGRQSWDIAAEAKDKAQESLSRCANATTHYVAEQPMRSVLMAAAVGAAVALLVASSRQR